MGRGKIAIYGAGGHCRSLVPLIRDLNLEIEGIYDESFRVKELICSDTYLVGCLQDLPLNIPLALAVGKNSFRTELFKSLSFNERFINLIHPSSLIRDCEIGHANQIFPFAYIGEDCSVGSNNIINTGSVIEHESEIGNNCHVSINSTVSGRVTIGDNCFIGAGATVIDNISICSNVTVGAGSVVINNIDIPGTYAGCPAKKIGGIQE